MADAGSSFVKPGESGITVWATIEVLGNPPNRPAAPLWL